MPRDLSFHCLTQPTQESEASAMDWLQSFDVYLLALHPTTLGPSSQYDSSAEGKLL